MKKLNIFIAGVSALVLTAGLVLLTQGQKDSYAATTLLAENELVAIGGTTDGLPMNQPLLGGTFSPDGNVVVFSSQASNLPNAGGTGMYAYNTKTNTTSRIDVSTAGSIADSGIRAIKISETGRYITFISNASNLLDTPYTNRWDSVYLRDTQTGVTTRVGGGSSVTGGAFQNSERNLGISNDGRFRLAASRYINSTYPYLYRIVIGDNSIVSGNQWTTLGVGDGNEGSWSSSAVRGDLSCDGAFAVYHRYSDINLADLRNSANPTVTTLTTSGSSPMISCNGRYVLYTTMERTIVPTPAGMKAGMHHLVRYDRISGEKIYVNSNSSGVFTAGFQNYTGNEPYENLYQASISDKGDVVFKYNNYMYLKHLSDGSGTLESIAKNVNGNYINVQYGSISGTGEYIYFYADPYSLGMTASPGASQLIRTKTNL